MTKLNLTSKLAGSFYALWCCDATDEASRAATPDARTLFAVEELGPEAQKTFDKMVARGPDWHREALRFVASTFLAGVPAKTRESALRTWVREFLPLDGDPEEDSEVWSARKQTLETIRGEIRHLNHL